MNTTTTTLLALAILAGPAYAQRQPGPPMAPQVRPDTAASPQAPAAPAPASAPAPAASEKSYHYWLHPKLGMVKIDKNTHFIVEGRRTQQQAPTNGGAPGN